MSKITAVRARALSVPVERPTRMSTRLLAKRDFLLVEVETNASEPIGLGYSYAGTAGGRLLATAVDELLMPALLGLEAEEILRNYDRLFQETLLTGRRGGVIRSISAIDMALWDLSAKKAGMPLAVLLGGTTGPVAAYASGGYYRDEGVNAEEAVRAEILHNEALGFADHKIKVGGLSVAEDARRVASAVEAVRPGGRLALDANNAYRTADEALIALRAFERVAGERGLWWMEEPLSPEDLSGHAELARRSETPIATGEIHQTRHEFRALIESRAATILQPDVGVIGGVSEWLRVARTAESFNLPVAPHWHANAHVHLAAATPNCLTVEHFDLDKDIYNFERLLTEESRLGYADGAVICPDRPGLGIEFDLPVVARYEVAR